MRDKTARVRSAELEAKEVQLGFRLRDGYRNFLLNRANGGAVKDQRTTHSGVGLEVLFGVNHAEEWADLDANLNVYRELIHPRLPANWLD